MKLIEMKQKRATIVTSMRAIMDKAEKTAGDHDELKNLEAEFDRISLNIENEEKQVQRERLIGEVENNLGQVPGKKRDAAFDAFCNVLRAPTLENVGVYNALQQTNPTQAGYLVAPEKFTAEVIQTLNNIMAFRQMAKVLPPLQGAQSLGFPKRTSRMVNAAWGTELSAPTTDTSLAFGKREFKPNPATLEILLSKTLLRNMPSVDAYIRDEMAYSNSELQEKAFLSGDGIGKPLGVFTAHADGISTNRDVATGNAATAPTYEGIVSAKYAIKEQYRRSKKLNWMFHRDAIKKLCLLQDVEGQYIWALSARDDEPDRLAGIRVTESEYVPNTFTANQYVGILGDFDNYWICDSLVSEINVLTELYARTNQVDYISRFEVDGMPVVEEAFARVKLGAG